MTIPHPTRRDFLCTLTATAATLAATLAVTRHVQASRKPNFTIIFTDDQGYGDVGAYGAKGFKTPNLDRMAAEGVRFTDFCTPATVCTPSRAALLTGCYPKRVGLHEQVLFPFSKEGLNLNEVTLPERLRPLGYATACIGRWHLGHHPQFMPNRQGFDYFFGVPYSNDMDAHRYRNPKFQAPPLPLYENEQLVEEGPDQAHLTRRYTESAVQFIEKHKEAPFFLYVAHNMPHLPWHASKKFLGSSEHGLYGDVIQEIDWGVGEILSALKEHGIDKDTLVVFTSDNGPVIRLGIPSGGSAGPLRGAKSTTWEGGPRVPCIARWPEHIPEGSTCRALATVMDVLPTFVGLAGGELPETPVIDGHDIRALLFEPQTAQTPYDALYYYARNGKLEAIREGDWKLHTAKIKGWTKKDGPFPISLYNLKEDVGEQHNVAKEHPELVKRLRIKMHKFDKKLAAEARPTGKIQ